MTTTKPFPVVRAGDIPRDERPARWLIEGLWGAQAAGLLGGHPKACKSWLGLEMAVSVATGSACLGRFAVSDPGPTLVYLAEDSLQSVRERLACLARHRDRELEDLDVHVITVPRIRLDIERDQGRLVETVRSLQPRLLLLDPLVRLHALNENSAEEISLLLSFLRDLQRQFELALITVHHTRKSGAGASQAGLGLRGSGDLWAFGDTNLYLRRRVDRLELTVEHRFAAAPEPVALRLVDDHPETVHLEIVANANGGNQNGLASLCDAAVNLLKSCSPLTRGEMREQLRVKNQRLGEALGLLQDQGQIEHTASGWTVTGADGHDRSRSLPMDDEGTERSEDDPLSDGRLF